MQDMPVAQNPRGFVVEWQLADDAAIGAVHRVIDLLGDPSEGEVVLTDDAGVSRASGG